MFSPVRFFSLSGVLLLQIHPSLFRIYTRERIIKLFRLFPCQDGLLMNIYLGESARQSVDTLILTHVDTLCWNVFLFLLGCFQQQSTTGPALVVGSAADRGADWMSICILPQGWMDWMDFSFYIYKVFDFKSEVTIARFIISLASPQCLQIWPQKQQWLKDGQGCSEFTDLLVTQWCLETCDVLALQSQNTRFYLKNWEACPFYIYDTVASCFLASFELYRELSKCRCFSFINV